MNIIIEMEAAPIRNAMLFAAKKDMREALHYVYISRHYVAATDGTSLYKHTIHTSELDENESLMIKLCSKIPVRSASLIINTNYMTIDAGSKIIPFKLLIANRLKFPNIESISRRMTEPKSPGVAIGMNPAFIAKAVCLGKYVKFEFYGPNNNIKLTSPSTPDAFVVIASQRLDKCV